MTTEENRIVLFLKQNISKFGDMSVDEYDIVIRVAKEIKDAFPKERNYAIGQIDAFCKVLEFINQNSK